MELKKTILYLSLLGLAPVAAEDISLPQAEDPAKCRISVGSLIRELKAQKDQRFIGRAQELARLNRIIEMGRHPLIIGDQGAGKTGMVEFLAQQVELGNIRSLQPESTVIKTLDWRSLTATQDLMLAERETPEVYLMREVLQAEREQKKLVLHIPEYDVLFEKLDSPNTPQAQRALAARIRLLMSEKRIIVVAEAKRVTESLERDPGFRQFERLALKPLSREDMLASLAIEAKALGETYKVRFNDSSLSAALTIAERNFPGDSPLSRAKDLLKEAALDLRDAQAGKPVIADYLQSTIAEYERIIKLLEDVKDEYPDLIRRLNTRVSELQTQLGKETEVLESQTYKELGLVLNEIAELKNQKDKLRDPNGWLDLDRQINQKTQELERLQNQLSAETRDQRTSDPTLVTSQVIAGVASRNLGRSVRYNVEEAADFAAGLLPFLKSRIFGQDAALEEVAELVASRIIRSNDPSRTNPLVMEFMGPTGTGKTELSKALAEYLTGSEENLNKWSGTEMKEAHNVARFIGAPPGYAGFDGELGGAQLVKAIKENPDGVFLYDEWKQFHPDIRIGMMDMFDNGRLRSGTGEVADASRTVKILADNFGEEFYSQSLDPSTGRFTPEGRERIMRARREASSEAELARINIILFEPIPQEVARNVVDREIERLSLREPNQGKIIEVPQEVRNVLYKDAYTVEGGVRKVKDKVERELQRLIDRSIYGPREGRPQPGARLEFKLVDNKIVLEVHNPN